MSACSDHTLFSKARLESDSLGREENLSFCSLYKWIWTLANSNVSFCFNLSLSNYIPRMEELQFDVRFAEQNFK